MASRCEGFFGFTGVLHRGRRSRFAKRKRVGTPAPFKRFFFPILRFWFPGCVYDTFAYRRPFGDSVSHTRRCDTPRSAKPRSVAKMGRYTAYIQVVLSPNHTVLIPGMRVRHVRLSAPLRGLGVAHVQVYTGPQPKVLRSKPPKSQSFLLFHFRSATAFLQCLLRHNWALPQARRGRWPSWH